MYLSPSSFSSTAALPPYLAEAPTLRLAVLGEGGSSSSLSSSFARFFEEDEEAFFDEGSVWIAFLVLSLPFLAFFESGLSSDDSSASETPRFAFCSRGGEGVVSGPSPRLPVQCP